MISLTSDIWFCQVVPLRACMDSLKSFVISLLMITGSRTPSLLRAIIPYMSDILDQHPDFTRGLHLKARKRPHSSIQRQICFSASSIILWADLRAGADPEGMRRGDGIIDAPPVGAGQSLDHPPP